MKLFDIISLEQYQTQRQESWPTYQDIVDGKKANRTQDQISINSLFDAGFQIYREQGRSNDIAEGNRLSQKQIFYDKHVKQNSLTHCGNPWHTMGVNSYGDVFICASPAWIPKFVGNIFDADDIFSVLNSASAQQIRHEIKNGRYFFCNLDLCDYASRNEIQYPAAAQQETDLIASAVPEDPELLVNHIPRNVVLDFDHTCNYQCPSCRTHLINHNKHPIVRAFNDRIVQKIKTLIIDNITDHPVTIRWAGGEPFISAVYLDLLQYVISTKKTNIDHVIHTNGSYLKSKSDLVIPLMQHTRELRISFDAATAETYGRVRVNGVWNNLIDNVTWLLTQQRMNRWTVNIVADFVVQQDNYREIPQFRALCDDLGIEKINWQKLWNWDTWQQADFDSKNVHDINHPEHTAMLELLCQVQR